MANRLQLEQTDYEDDFIILDEWSKCKKVREQVSTDIFKITDIKPSDWIELIIFANKTASLRTRLTKEIFLLEQRTGMDLFYDWHPSKFGADSINLKKELENLEGKKEIKLEQSSKKDGTIMYNYILENVREIKKLWERLPLSIKKVIEEITKDTSKSNEDLLKWIHIAYPRFAVNAVA